MTAAIPVARRADELLRQLDPLVRAKPLQALLDYESGDAESALRYWKKTTDADDDRGLQALRSLAVHHHRQAYALEVEGKTKQALRHWAKAVPLWSRALQTRTFRELLPQYSSVSTSGALEAGELDAMIELLCECLLSPHVTLAAHAAERKEWTIAAGHVAILRESGVPDAIIAAALDRLAERVCRMTHETITHTTFEEATADAHEALAAFTRKHLPERINGVLELVVVEVWRALKPAETGEGVASASKRLRTPETAALIDALAAARDAETNAVVKHQILTTLRELADAASHLQLTWVQSLADKREKLVDRVNAAMQRAQTLYDARRTIDLALRESQQLHEDAEAGMPLCEELAARFGEGTFHPLLRQRMQRWRELAAKDLTTLRSLREGQ